MWTREGRSIRKADSGEDRLRAVRTQATTEHDSGRRIRGSQQDPHSRQSHSAQEDAQHNGSEETAPSKTDSEQADLREAQIERASKLERGRRVVGQLQESRDTLLDGTPEQKALSHRDAEHQPHSGSKSRTS